MFFFNQYFYFITLALQAICAIHCLRRGRQNNWIWIIIFLPLIGSLAYIFSEIITRHDLNQVQSGFGNLLNPGGSIKQLENNFRFSDTFNNRIALADAYLAAGNFDKAIELYESGLSGNFTENEYVQGKLIIAYFESKRFQDIIPLAQKIYKLPQFPRSRQHMIYAIALDEIGQREQAEKEFRLMKTRFSNYEARYEYARILNKHKCYDQAREILKEMIGEADHLGPRERRANRHWLSLAKEELRKTI